MNFSSLPKKTVFLLLGLPFVLLALPLSASLVQQETQCRGKAAGGTIYYMAQNRPQGHNDTDNGSEAHPWCTFQQTSNVMVARDATYAPGAVIIIDNNDPGFTSTGVWKESSGPYPYGTNSLWSDVWKDPVDNAAWTPEIATLGSYNVYAWWTSNTGRVADAPYTINYDGGQATIKVNQRTNGGRWNLLGTFSFASGARGNVTLRAISEDTESGGNSVCADAIKFEHVNPSTTWTLADFDGEKMDYAYWLREGYGVYHIDDYPGLKPRNGLVNDALLYLAFGPNEPSTFDSGKSVREAYKERMLAWADGGMDFGGDQDRVLASIAESYLLMRDEGIFSTSEQQHIEKDLFLHWANQNATEAYGHQFVPHALAAITGYVLDTTRTGVNYSGDVSSLWSYARNNALDFGETWGPIENSAHYNSFVFISMMRISIYCNGGSFPASHKENLRKSVEWIFDTYPHSGFTLSFGETWRRDHVRQLFSFLVGASYYLDDGNPQNVEVAQNAKWLANKIFEYGFNRDIGANFSPHSGEWKEGVRGEPMWLWMYLKDLLAAQKPHVSSDDSKGIYGMMGDSYSSSLPNNLKLDKVAHRDGCEDDSFYLVLDMAPSCGKNKPYANSIVNFVYGSEAFSSGKTRDRYNTVWEKRNVVYPHNGNKYNAVLGFMHSFNDYSASKTTEGDWDRYISFPKNGSYAVVFDFAPSSGTAYWHFVSTPSPIWRSDWVELTRGDYKLNAYYPNNHGWYSVSHFDDDAWSEPDHQDQIWYVDSPSRELQLSGTRTWATVLHPHRGGSPTVTAINPSNRYPDAVGVKLVRSGYTDWHGASRTSGEVKYDEKIEIDAEIFWAREKKDESELTLSFSETKGSPVKIKLGGEPNQVKLNGVTISNWSFSSGWLTVNLEQGSKGNLEILEEGGPAPTSTFTPTATSTPAPQPTSTPTPTPMATNTPTATPTATPAQTTTPTPTPNPNELIIDNNDPGFTSTGVWNESSYPNPYGTNSLWSDVWIDPVDSATWTPDIVTPGNYKVYAWWTSGTGRVSDAPYTVNHDGGQTTVKVNQRTNGGQWNLLGTFSFASGTTGNVTLHAVSEDTESGGNSVCADATRFQYAGVYTIYLPIIWKNW